MSAPDADPDIEALRRLGNDAALAALAQTDFGSDDGAVVLAPARPDPLAGVVRTNNTEADCKAELNAVQRAFAERRAQDIRRFVAATDSEYWCCLCFQSREQKEAFLCAKGWCGDKYLDGLTVARQEGIALPEASIRFLTSKPDAASNDLALPLRRQE